MKANEIFRRLSNEELDQMVLVACDDAEVPERIAGGVLTYQSIPLKRFSKLPEETRKAYVRRTLRMPRAADLALYVLSAGLTHGRGGMISEFLDALGLAHEGPNLSIEGEIPEPAKKTLTAAVDKLLAAHPHRAVALYLHAFASQPDAHWKNLNDRLSSDPKLALVDQSGG